MSDATDTVKRRLPPMKTLVLDAEEIRVFDRLRASRYNPSKATQAERKEFERLIRFASFQLLEYLVELMHPGSAPHMRFGSWAEAKATPPEPGFELDEVED